MKQLFIYNQAVPVTLSQHRDVSVRVAAGFDFAVSLNAVPLTTAEFLTASQSYPIVFAGNVDVAAPSVVLGLSGSQNLFVDEAGQWTGDYVPAFLRQYPFVFGADPGKETLTLCIDETYAGCNRAGRGERLFDSDGKRTQFLESRIGLLRRLRLEHERSQAFVGRLREAGLLEPMQATFRGADGKQAKFGGFLAVSREKIKGLDASTLKALAVSGDLDLIYAHLHSLNHINALVKRLPASPPETETAADETPEPAST